VFIASAFAISLLKAFVIASAGPKGVKDEVNTIESISKDN
jgi:hypothetical protein